MSDFHVIDEQVIASPQIGLADLDEAKARGVTLVVCNRPDGEDADQPTHEEMAEAAAERGLTFTAIPITHSGFSEPQIEAMEQALDGAEGKVLAYCRSGTRSTLLWSLVQARKGRNPDEIAAQAAAAGYDVTPVRPAMDMLASRAGR